MVAVDAVDATLGGVNEDIFGEGGLADALGDVLLFRERLARGFIFHEFDAEEQADAANFGDMRVRFERRG